MFFSRFSAAFLVCALLANGSPAYCENAQPSAGVDNLAKEILLNEIKLAKFNLRYRQNSAKQGRWKGLRYFAFQEANAGLTEAGLIVGVNERMSHARHNDFKKLKFPILETGNILGGVGQTIGASGSALEFGINSYHMFDAYRKGFGSRTAIRYVAEVDGQLDQQLADLSKAASSEPEGELKQVHQKEALVLSDIHDLLINEFRGFHVGATRTLVYQQSFYLIDIAKNVTGAVGNLYGFKALQKRNRKFNRPASVLVTTSGALIIGAPILSRLIGYGAAVVDKYALDRAKLQDTECHLNHLDEHLAQLKTALTNGDKEVCSSAVARAALYESHQTRLVKQINLSTREVRAGNSIAIQNVLSGAIVGGTKLANGITFMDAGYRWYKSPRQTNLLIGGGSIPYLCGSAYALADNVRIQAMREITYHRLKQRNELPGQIIKDQLAQLDTLETQVSTGKF
jgi:hypothetical protein